MAKKKVKLAVIPKPTLKGSTGMVVVDNSKGNTVYLTPVHIDQEPTEKLRFLNWYKTLVAYLQKTEPEQFIPADALKDFEEEVLKGTALEGYSDKVTFILI